MEQRLQENLLDGEQILWMGRPAPFKLMRCPYRTAFYVTWLVCGVVIATAAYHLLPVFPHSDGVNADLLVILIVVSFFPILLSLRPILDKICLEKNTIYAITNYRVVSLVRDDFMYIPIHPQLQITIEAKEQDCGNVCFGDAAGQDVQKSRANAVLGIRKEHNQNNMLGILFYHVQNPEKLLTYFT